MSRSGYVDDIWDEPGRANLYRATVARAMCRQIKGEVGNV